MEFEATKSSGQLEMDLWRLAMEIRGLSIEESSKGTQALHS